MRLDAERLSERGADGTAHQDVVREHEVGREQLAQRCDVRVDVAAALVGGEILQQPRLEPLVAVEHEHGQQPVGQLDLHRRRAPDRVALRSRLLRDDRHVMPGAAPLLRQLPRVDVRPGPVEQVPVPEEDPHAAT